MQYTHAARNTLNITVRVATRPYSNAARAVRVLAATHEGITVANAQYYNEFATTITQAQLQQHVKSLLQLSNSSKFELDIAANVQKLLKRNG